MFVKQDVIIVLTFYLMFLVWVCVLPQQKDHEHLEELNAEMQRMEERVQEERMERVKLEVELGREKDCNRVRWTIKKLLQSFFSCHCHLFWELVPKCFQKQKLDFLHVF